MLFIALEALNTRSLHTLYSIDAAGVRPANQRQEFANSDSDEIPLVTLGTSGEVEIFKDGGASPPPAAPYLITSDGNQPLPTLSDVLVTTPPVTQLSSSMVTSAPAFLSQGTPSQPAPITTTTLYMETTPSTSESTSTTTTVFMDRLSSQSTNPVSTDLTITVDPSSDSTQSSFLATTTLLSGSFSLPISTTSSTSFVSSMVSSSLKSSFTSVSIQPIVISTSSLLLSSSALSSSSLSSSTNSNSSTVSSRSLNSQPAIQTIVAPPLFGKPSNLNVHSAPYYIGIIFGSIAGIAILTALIAWWIRIQSHARRRRATRTLVPWAKLDDDDDGGLEAGRGSTGVGDSTMGAQHLGNREDLAHVQAWTPRGDRDVGEPKRSDSYFHGSIYNHAIPGHNLLSAESLGALSSFDDYHPSSLRPSSQRQLPAHLIDEDAAARATQEDGSRQNRHLSVANPGPSDCFAPWNQRQAESTSRSMVDRLRNLDKLPTKSSWEDLGPLPLPGEPDQTRDAATIEAWSSSVKSSLVNAFNAVASNLSGAPRLAEDDKFSAPSKRAFRKSVRGTFWDEKTTRIKGDLVRDNTLSSINSTAWTLEETGNGAGVVHIKNNPILRRPAISTPNLSFGDGESISTYNDQTSCAHRTPTHEAQIPLIASSKPQPVHIRPDAYSSRRISSKTIHSNTVSRNSTVYSAASLRSEGRNVRGVARLPHMLPGIDISTPKFQRTIHGDDDDSVVIYPDTISRLSSTDSSVLRPTPHGNPELNIHVAAQALKDRQKPALREAY